MTAVRERIDMDLAAEAVFVSDVQPSESFSDEFFRDLVSVTVGLYGADGCAAIVAQEFGDHPEAAAARMGWCRLMVGAS
jgi:hypothetical protein